MWFEASSAAEFRTNHLRVILTTLFHDAFFFYLKTLLNLQKSVLNLDSS